MEVIADALNVPHDLMDDFKRWSDDAIVGFGDNATVDQLVAAERASTSSSATSRSSSRSAGPDRRTTSSPPCSTRASTTTTPT